MLLMIQILLNWVNNVLYLFKLLHVSIILLIIIMKIIRSNIQVRLSIIIFVLMRNKKVISDSHQVNSHNGLQRWIR